MKQEVFDDYVFCLCYLRFKNVAEIREFAEQVFKCFNRPILKMYAHFKEPQDSKNSKLLRYVDGQNKCLDKTPISTISAISFWHEKKGMHCSLRINIEYDKVKAKQKIQPFDNVSLIRHNPGSKPEDIYHLAKDMVEILSRVSIINYLIADQMEEHKQAETFVAGMGYSERGWFDDAVAYSMGNSRVLHSMLPYLFMYNYHHRERLLANSKAVLEERHQELRILEAKEHTEIFFPRCFGLELEEYNSLPEWKEIYDFLSGLGIIVFPEDLINSAKLNKGIW